MKVPEALLTDKRKAKTEKDKADAIDKLGDWYFSKDKYEEADGEYSEAATLLEPLVRNDSHSSSTLSLAKIYRKRGDLRIEMGMYHDSLKDFKKYRKLSQHIGDALEVQRSYHSLGRAFFMLGITTKDSQGERDHRSRQFFEEGNVACQLAIDKIPKEPICNFREQTSMKLVVLLNQKEILMHLGMLPEAEKCCHEALKTAGDAQDDEKKWNILQTTAEVKLKRGQPNEALKVVKQMETLVEVHGKGFDDQKQLLLDTRFLKSKVLVSLQQFAQAKTELKKLKRKNSQMVDDEFLGIVVQLSKIEKCLKKEANKGKKSKLNEAAGDKLGELCDYEADKKDTYLLLTSNLYYKNALDEVPETSTKRVAQLHESMALNHECLGSYDKAKESYLQSLRACRGHPIQELKMVLELAKLADKADEAKEVVVKGFRDALKMASDIPEKPAYKSHVLKYWYEYHKANLDQEESDLVAEELKGHLRDTAPSGFPVSDFSLLPDANFVDDSAAGSDSGSEAGDNYVDSLLGNVSEDSNGTDDEDGDEGKRKVHKFRVTVNIKGETKLHTNCQEPGNLEEIQRLIRMGHPVNVADYSKFTPLHEASNFGCLEYVEELHKAKANLNMKSKDGVTPLITAAANGHLDILEYLLNAGAKTCIQDDYYWTAKDYLEELLNKVDCEPGEQAKAEILLRRMKESLKGVKLLPKMRVSKAFENEGEENENRANKFFIQDHAKRTSDSRKQRRRSVDDRDKVDFDKRTLERAPCNDRNGVAVNAYVEAIQSLRSDSTVPGPSKLSTKRAAVSPPSSPTSITSISPPKTNNFALTDDWLEDDIGMGRKISSSAPKKQSKLKLSSRTSTSKRQRLSIDDDFEVEEKDSTVALEDDSPPIPPVEEDITFVSEPPSSSRLTVPKAPSSVVFKSNSGSNRIKFMVNVQGKKLVLMEKCAKVKDLADKIVDFYSKCGGRMPSVKLEDQNGCELGFDDNVTDVFIVPQDGTAIAVSHSVTGWTFKPAPDTYAEMCSDLKVLSLDPIKEALNAPQLSSVDISFSSVFRGNEQATALLRTLTHRPNLTEINLAGNKLGFDRSAMTWIREMAIGMVCTPTLRKVDLSNNFLGPIHIDKLSKDLKSTSENSDNENHRTHACLSELNLSFNSFPNQSPLTMMELINELPNLRSLDLSACDLTSDLFQYNVEDWSDRLEKLSHLNVSHNPKMTTNTVKALLRGCSLANLVI